LKYRLFPELHSMLDIIDDVLTLYRGLLNEKNSPSDMIIMGDSAGAALTPITVQTLISQSLLIACGIILPYSLLPI
jgi:acetyl esterase/lipase